MLVEPNDEMLTLLKSTRRHARFSDTHAGDACHASESPSGASVCTCTLHP